MCSENMRITLKKCVSYSTKLCLSNFTASKSGFNIQSNHLHLRLCALFPFSLVWFSLSSRKVGIRNSSANAKQTAFQFTVWLFITFIYISHLLPRRWNCLHRYTYTDLCAILPLRLSGTSHRRTNLLHYSKQRSWYFFLQKVVSN